MISFFRLIDFRNWIAYYYGVEIYLIFTLYLYNHLNIEFMAKVDVKINFDSVPKNL